MTTLSIELVNSIPFFTVSQRRNFGILIAQFYQYLRSLIFQKNCKNGILVDFRQVSFNFSKIPRKMSAKILAILLTFFIFVAVNVSRADDVKWVKNTVSQQTMIALEENRVAFQKTGQPGREPVTALKKLRAGFQSTISYSPSDYGAIPGTTILGVNFLRTFEEMKNLRLPDSLYKVIYSYEFFQDPWKGGRLSSGQTLNTDSSSSDLAQSALRLYLNPNGDKYVEEGKTRSIFKLLQFRKEEIFGEIFMGFRFSFGSKSTPMHVQMNISPFPDKGPGFIIAF
jgi:hypothetical protein